MIVDYLSFLSNEYILIKYTYYIIMIIGLIALILFPIHAIFMKIKFRNRKEAIYQNFLHGTPELFKSTMELKIGGWLKNMAIPFYPIWSYQLIEKWDREQVIEWRRAVKSSFGNDYKYFKIYLILKLTALVVFVPMVIVLLIDNILKL